MPTHEQVITALVDRAEAAEAQLAEANARAEANYHRMPRRGELGAALERAVAAEARAEAAERDIEELVICEECGEEDAKLEINNCYPPRYCHACQQKLVEWIVKLRAALEAAMAEWKKHGPGDLESNAIWRATQLALQREAEAK